MLLDMYLFFCLPFPQLEKPAPKASPRPRGGSGRRTSSSPRAAARREGQEGKAARGKRRPSLRVIDGGRAGVP